MPNAKTNLVIVESPSKAKTIGKYLGPDYQVKASMGHLRDLRKSTMSVDIDHDFEPEYYPIKGKEDIIKDLQSAAAKSANVFLATAAGKACARSHCWLSAESLTLEKSAPGLVGRTRAVGCDAARGRP